MPATADRDRLQLMGIMSLICLSAWPCGTRPRHPSVRLAPRRRTMLPLRIRNELHFDHIVPVSLGGASVAANVELLCRDCNLRKGTGLFVPTRREGADDDSSRCDR